MKQLINIITEGGGKLLAPVCQQTSSQRQRAPSFYRYMSTLAIEPWQLLCRNRFIMEQAVIQKYESLLDNTALK